MNALDTFRSTYKGQYDHVPNAELAYRVWAKFYRDKLGMGEFADKAELTSQEFDEMLMWAKTGGHQPTTSTFAEGYVPEGSRARAALSGQTFGAADEIVGGLTAGAQVGSQMLNEKFGTNLPYASDKPFNELYATARDRERALMEQYRKAAPAEAIGVEMAGSFANPAMWLKTPGIVANLGAKTQAAVKGAAGGAAYGYGSGVEGERGQSALEGAAFGALFGAGVQQASNWAGRAIQGVANKTDWAILNSIRNPTVESLKAAKNQAYKEVDKIGTIFGVDDMQTILQNASASPRLQGYTPEAYKRVLAAQKLLESYQGKALNMSQIDGVRKSLWRIWNSSKPDEQYMIRDIIRVMDDVIDAKLGAGDSSLYRAAQLANSRYRKAELLEKAFETAERNTAATGSGGNVFNQYRQAVNRILKDKNNIRYFSDDEIASMTAFVKGEFGEGTLRTISKLSPSGNGLMAALNVGAAAIDPTFLALTATGMAAKSKLDRQIGRQARNLVSEIGQGGVPFGVPSPVQGITAPTGVLVGNRPEEEEELR